MKYVGIDTSYQYLNIVLIEDGIKESLSISCPKQQSELLIPKWKELMDRVGWSPMDVDGMVITKGPGSYTGIRIAMTVAKVFASSAKKALYTVSSLQLVAGDMEHCIVLMDARGKRAYVGGYHKGTNVLKDQVMTLDEVEAYLQQNPHLTVLGDGHLVGLEDNYPNMANHFYELKDVWEKVENVDCLQPDYLKKSEDYLVK